MRRLYIRIVAMSIAMTTATFTHAQTLTLEADHNEISATEAGSYDKVEYIRQVENGQMILASFPARLDGYYFGPDAQRLVVREAKEDGNGATKFATDQMGDKEDFVPGKQYIITPTRSLQSITCLLPGRKISVPATTAPLVFRTLEDGTVTELVDDSKAQTLSITFTDSQADNFWNALSTKEIDKITHTYGTDGKALIAVEMKTGSVHTYGTDSVENIVSNKAEDLSAYEIGDLVQITRDVDYDVDTTFIAMMYPNSGTIYSYCKKICDMNNKKLRYSQSLISPVTVRYHLYDFTYVSKDIDGKKIKLSGRMFYPYSTDFVNGNKLQLSKVLLENHYTTMQNEQSPTSSFENQQLAGMCTKGYLVIEPDYLGFGTTKNRSQLFIDQELTSRHVVDCLKAAMQLKARVNSDDNYVGIPIADDAPLLNEGVSQGASVAVGVQRYIENNLTDAERSAIPQLEETRVCAGPYAPYLTLDTYVKWDSLYYCAIVPMLMQSLAVAHPDILVDEQGNTIPVRNFFSDKFNAMRYPAYRNYNIWEMLDSKEYNSYDVMNALWSAFGSVENKKASIHAMFNPELMTDSALNESHPYIQALKKVLEMSDNTSGWCPKHLLKLWHGTHDDIVPYECSTAIYKNITTEYPEALITLSDINDEGLGGHTSTCGIWMMGELLGVDANSVVSMLEMLK